MPCIDHEFHRKIWVDDIADLPDCPLKFEYGKPFLPQFMFEGLPVYMTRMHNWYIRACRLGLRSIWARYDPDIFGAKTDGIQDIMFDFQDIQEMVCLKELSIEMVRVWCM